MSIQPEIEINESEDHTPETWAVYQDADGGDLWILDSHGKWSMIDYHDEEVVAQDDETWGSIVLNYGPLWIVDRVQSDGEINNLNASNY